MTRRSRLLVLLAICFTAGMLWPSELIAQGRSRGAAVRSGTAVPRHVAPRPYHRPYYYPRYSGYYYPRSYYGYYAPWYRPYYPYYPGFSWGFGVGWFGYGGGYWGPWGYPYAYPYGYPYYGYYDNTGSARLQITPRNAQVYVDGYFVGLVDEFDGSWQRLRVEIGEHDLQVYLDGHQTFTQRVLFTRGQTIRLQHVMQPLGPGESAEKPSPNPAAVRPPDPGRPPMPSPRYRQDDRSEFGTMSLRVNPPDAEILVDGESWDRPEGEDRFSIDLPEGPHQVEVRREGYRPYSRTIEVRRGRTVTLNVSLSGS